MARCRLCARTDIEAINAAIASGAPIARVAREYGASRSAMGRHLGHMTPAQRDAREAAQVSPTSRASWSTATVGPVARVRLDSATDLFDIIRRSLATAQRICTAAEASGDFNIALQAIRTINVDVQTAAKLMGLVMPEMLALVNVSQAAAPVSYRAGESPLDVLRARLDVLASRRDPPEAERRAEGVAHMSPPLPEGFNMSVAESDEERRRKLSASFRTIHY